MGGRDRERRGPGEAKEEARDERWAAQPVSGARAGCREEAGGRALTYIIIVTAVVISNVSIITIDIDINITKGAGTCTSHAGADVTSTTAPIPKESLSRDP